MFISRKGGGWPRGNCVESIKYTFIPGQQNAGQNKKKDVGLALLNFGQVDIFVDQQIGMDI
jgi:hypothetical protein